MLSAWLLPGGVQDDPSLEPLHAPDLGFDGRSILAPPCLILASCSQDRNVWHLASFHRRDRAGHPIRLSRWSPTRIALAMAVSAGFTAPMLGKKLVSTTYRLSTSCALQLTSRTELAGSVPNRQVPAW